MKKLIVLITTLTLASTSGAQNVNIPDVNFKNALIEAGVDTDEDGEISYAEAEAVNYLNLSADSTCPNHFCEWQNQIANLAGIEAFIGLDTLIIRDNALMHMDLTNSIYLRYLDCSGNQLTELDLTSNNSLEYLACDVNRLTELNISNNPALHLLRCQNNLLTTLDVTSSPELENLSCQYNNLSELDPSSNPELVQLHCQFNQLNSLNVLQCSELRALACGTNQLNELDLSNNTNLQYLSCEYNQLNELDLSNNTNLQRLSCGYNQLSSLDLTDNSELTELRCPENKLNSLILTGCGALFCLYCEDNELTGLDISDCVVLNTMYCEDNKLTSLDISNNKMLGQEPGCFYSGIRLAGMPMLHEICVWEGFSEDSLEITGLDDSPNVFFTTDCLATAINSYEDEHGISIYPNPSDDFINIEIENANDAMIEIYNLNGKRIFSKRQYSNTETIDISSYRKGIYFCTIRSKDCVTTRKIIKL